MTRVKNVGGGPSDEDPMPLSRQPTDAKGKATKNLSSRRHNYPYVDTTRAAAEHAERGGARSGVVIAYQLSSSTRATLA